MSATVTPQPNQPAGQTASKPRRETWWVNHYDLTQITLTQEFVGVWAEEQPDGSCTLFSQVLDGVGLARCESVLYERAGEHGSRKVKSDDQGHVIVGLELYEGEWM